MTTTYEKKLPRGFRNKNPLNIRMGSTPWTGQVVPGTDKHFCQFERMAYGWRAAFKLLRKYYFVHKCRTISDIINRWAPPSDGNNTEVYIRRVGNMAAFLPLDELPAPDVNPTLWIDIGMAMAVVENGHEPAFSYYDAVVGWLLADDVLIDGFK